VAAGEPASGLIAAAPSTRTAAAAIFPTGVYLHLALNELFLSLRRARGGPTDAHALLLTPDPDKSFAPRL
jgi:hypothetical protein